MCINEFVRNLERDGHGPLLAEERRTVSAWIDNKLTLRRLRLEAGLSQEQLADRMNTSQAQIARMESGRQDLQLSTMKRLAIALHVDLHKVVDAARE